MQFLIIMVAGAITPPFGYIIFALKAAVPEVSLAELYPPAWLFTFVTLAGVALFAVFPDIITVLPRLMK
jgi:TRAP-type C4-dicarboxylate transport system permease large subunit